MESNIETLNSAQSWAMHDKDMLRSHILSPMASSTALTLAGASTFHRKTILPWMCQQTPHDYRIHLMRRLRYHVMNNTLSDPFNHLTTIVPQLTHQYGDSPSLTILIMAAQLLTSEVENAALFNQLLVFSFCDETKPEIIRALTPYYLSHPHRLNLISKLTEKRKKADSLFSTAKAKVRLLALAYHLKAGPQYEQCQ